MTIQTFSEKIHNKQARTIKAPMRAWLSIGGLLISAMIWGQTERPHGDIARGKVVFENNCADCHDAYSEDVLTGPGLKGLKSGKLPDGKAATHDKLLDIINTGPAEMTSFKDRLTEQEKEDVVAFVMTL